MSVQLKYIQSDPPDDSGSDGERCCEFSDKLIMTCGDAAEALEAAEHALDEIALAIDEYLVADRGLPASDGRDQCSPNASRNRREVETQPKRISITRTDASWLLLGASLPIGSLVQSVSNTL